MILAFLLQPLAALAGTASFDCSKASTLTERIICVDPLLSEFDIALASAYRTLISQSFSPLEFRQEQASWLKKRDLCQDADCLRAAYRLRLAQLTDDPAWIPKDDWWFLAGNENPEVSRLRKLFVSKTGHSPSGQYFDLGSGAYFVLMEIGETSPGLWYAVPDTNELTSLLGPSVKMSSVRRTSGNIRTFRFEVHTLRYEGHFDIEVSDRLSRPKVTVVSEQLQDSKY
jgi:uncharacterized protein YecT (DUF1311 family)